MDFIKGLFALAVIGGVVWLATAFFDAVGGWPGVIVTVILIAVIVFLASRYFERTAQVDKLKKMPSEVITLTETARDSFGGQAVDALNRATVEFEEGRAPLFW